MKHVFKNGLPMGLGTQVMATLRGEQYRVAVRGWRENQYFIVDNPSFHGEAIRIAPQTGCSVNYTIDGVFINFKTAVMHSFSQAVSLMILEFPKKFDKHNLRKFQRQKASFSMLFGMGDSMDFTIPGTLRDLSMSGGLICSAHFLEKGHRINLAVSLPNGGLTGVRAEVRNVRRNPKNENEPFVIGLQFLGPTEEQNQVLRQFMESRVSERRSNNR